MKRINDYRLFKYRVTFAKTSNNVYFLPILLIDHISHRKDERLTKFDSAEEGQTAIVRV